MTILQRTRELSNGVHIPMVGYGTGLLQESEAAQLVRCAAGYGYRLFDAEQSNKNLTAVGEGLRACGVSRDELFLSLRLDPSVRTSDEVKEAIRIGLKALGTDVLDLALIDMPASEEEDPEHTTWSEAVCAGVWRAMEEALASSVVRAIGVSNFDQQSLNGLLEKCTVPPMVNQVKCGISETPENILSWCRGSGIVVISCSPLGHGHLLKNRELKAMAAKYGATTAQLCIRYAIELGTIPVPRALKEKYIRENAEVEFDISPDDMETLRAMHVK